MSFTWSAGIRGLTRLLVALGSLSNLLVAGVSIGLSGSASAAANPATGQSASVSGTGVAALAAPAEDFTYDITNGQVTITSYLGTAGAVEIPAAIEANPVTGIGDQAFYGCSSLTSVAIPSSVTNIGEFAFASCSSLTRITVDAANTKYASDGGVLFNKAKTTLIQCPCGRNGPYAIPSGVKSIEGAAFAECTGLTGITIPTGVVSIGNSAFNDCYSLPHVTIPDSVTNLGEFAFANCYSLTSLGLGAGVKNVGDYAFSFCDLPTLTIPNTVTNIGSYAFASCALVSVTIPDNVTSLGDSAFASCIGLQSVLMGASVNHIGDGGFSDCGSLLSVFFEGDAPESVGEGVFSAFDNGDGAVYRSTVYYIAGSAGWGNTFCGCTTAVWTPVTVTFDAGGGTESFSSRAYSVGNPYGELPAATYAGYAFAGWWTGSSGTGTGVDAETVVTRTTAYKLYAKWVKIPKLTIVGGGIDGETGAVAYVSSGLERLVFANEPAAGKIFDKWIVSPSMAALGEMFDAHQEQTTVTMPLISVTLTATYVTIPQLAVVGGYIEAEDEPAVYLLPFEVRQIFADEAPDGKVFDKWTVSPATASLGEGFSPKDVNTTVVMPTNSVTLTATYVTIPKLTVAGGGIEGADTNAVFALPGAEHQVFANAAASGKVFDKWTVNPATADLGEGFNARSETTAVVMPSVSVTLTATYIAIPKLTVTGGGIEGVDGNNAFVLPGQECQVFANEPATGKTFAKWTVAPATAALGEGFSISNASVTVVMPSVSVTLTATYVAIPKLTVTGGGIGGADGNMAFLLPGEEHQITAIEVAGKVFEKWTVTPATAYLGEAFNPRLPQTTVVMPWASVTLTAVYITSPGYVAVNVAGNLADVELSGIFWSVDSVAWVPVNDGNNYPLKPGTYSVSFKSTNVRWLAPAKQAVKVVFDQLSEVTAAATYVPIVSWQLSEESAAGSGTVTMSPANGQVLPGKGVTLTAQPASNCVFVGWAGLEGMPVGAERLSPLAVAPLSDTVYTARFRAKSDCLLPEIGIEAPTECMVGVAYSAVVDVNDEALPVKFTAASLPAGLKLDPVTGVISGVPSKAGTFNVTVGATGTAGAAEPQTYAFDVSALPAWAQGTFDGVAHVSLFNSETETEFPGTATMSVTALGGVAGKIVCGGTNYSFTAASYAQMAEGFDALGFYADAKAGKVSVPLSVSVQPLAASFDEYDLTVSLGGADGISEGTNATSEVHLRRNVWKDKGLTAVATNYTGYYTATLPGGEGYGSGYLAFTVDKAGGVKTAGKLADGTAVSLSGSLIMDEGGTMLVILYTVPTAYKGGCFYGIAEFVRSDDGTVLLRLADTEDPMLWDNRSAQATGAYGAMFARSVGISGGRYNTLLNLRNYYENGLSVGGVAMPPLSAAVKYTDWKDETQTSKITWTATEYKDAAGISPEGLVLSVTPTTGTGTGLSAPKSDTPAPLLDGTYDYTADTTKDGVSNTSGLTLTYTRATGLFTGSFKTWYDYASAVENTTGGQTLTHTSKTISFEGALTPVREEGDAEGRGFFLWADKSSFDSGKLDKYGNPILTSYSFNWSYDFLLMGN